MWKYIAVIAGLLYVLSPFDFLPDWIIGWGWLDDLVIVGFVARFIIHQLNKVKPSSQDAQGGRRSADEDRARSGRGGENRNGPQASDPAWDPHRVLAVDRHATDLEIKQAYRRLVNQYHPDKVQHLGVEFRELAEIKFKEIQRAYQELKPPAGRQKAGRP